jgi:hypothetical protein
MNHAKETLRKLLALLTLAFFAGPVSSTFAMMGLMSDEDMIGRAEIIAIVDISHVERARTKAWPFDYNEIAYASVQQTLKGTLPQTVKLYGGSSFTCIEDHFSAGRYLVFLVRHDDLLVACNGGGGICPITRSQVLLQRIKNPTATPKENYLDAYKTLQLQPTRESFQSGLSLSR